MPRRKNTKFIDPRYFMDEKMETIEEASAMAQAHSVDGAEDVDPQAMRQLLQDTAYIENLIKVTQPLVTHLVNGINDDQGWVYLQSLGPISNSRRVRNPFDETAKKLNITPRNFSDHLAKFLRFVLMPAADKGQDVAQARIPGMDSWEMQAGSKVPGTPPSLYDPHGIGVSLDPKTSDDPGTARALRRALSEEMQPDSKKFFEEAKAFSQAYPYWDRKHQLRELAMRLAQRNPNNTTERELAAAANELAEYLQVFTRAIYMMASYPEDITQMVAKLYRQQDRLPTGM